MTVVEETTAMTIDELHSPGVNVERSVMIPKKDEYPLMLEADNSGKSILIKQNDRIVLDTKKLDVKISGYVGTKNPMGPVEITIVRPDGSVDHYTVPINDDGKYHLPTKLASGWQTGTFQIIVKYGGSELGNLSFIVSDKQKGFGGILKKSEAESVDVLSQFESGVVDEEFLSGVGWLYVETQDPTNHRLYMLTKITPEITKNTGSKFEYCYLLLVIPVIVSVLLFRKNPKKIRN